MEPGERGHPCGVAPAAGGPAQSAGPAEKPGQWERAGQWVGGGLQRLICK